MFSLLYLSVQSFFSSLQEVLEVKCDPDDEGPHEDPLGVLSVNSLRRSVSQVIDGKSLTGEDDVWDPHISGHDSGMVRHSPPNKYINIKVASSL